MGRNQYVELEIKKPKPNGASSKLSAVQKPCDKMAEAIVMDGGSADRSSRFVPIQLAWTLDHC